MNKISSLEEVDKRIVEIQSMGQKKHIFEWKNDYKMYPCPNCGALDNQRGSYCFQYKLSKLRDDLK